MQQQTNATRSNVQIKLITDARKLLEKVRSQQLLSADSSLDSSFLCDPLDGEGSGGIIKKNSSDGNKDVSSTQVSKQSESGVRKNIDDDVFLHPSIPQSTDENVTVVAEDENVENSYLQEDIGDVISFDKLKEENMKLRQENYQLNEEMGDFEYKLYCLENTLGIIEDVEKSQKGCNVQNMDDDNGNLVPFETAKDTLSLKSADRDGPPSPLPMSKTEVEEIKVLRENNEKMVTAIKALAQATITQTKKHQLYRKRHHMTKQMVVEETEKLNALRIEKDKMQSKFYETRSNFLKERDIREELSNEIQLIAQKNNHLRQERQSYEDMRMKILDRVEFRDDDAASALSRISESSCFPILQKIAESGPAPKLLGRRQRLSKDKSIEKLIFKLTSQLKKRDDKIERLENKLKITMQYLQGALELEVARQDAAVVSLSEKRKPITWTKIEI